MSDLVLYDAMCRAIDAAYAVDEVKAIHDQAAMLQAAFRVAHNTDAEDRAYQIRMRAARKAGELSKKIEKAPGNQYSKSASPDRPEKQTVLDRAGISTQQASEWERLSEVPQDEFEAALATKSVRELIAQPNFAAANTRRERQLMMMGEGACELRSKLISDVSDVPGLADLLNAWNDASEEARDRFYRCLKIARRRGATQINIGDVAVEQRS